MGGFSVLDKLQADFMKKPASTISAPLRKAPQRMPGKPGKFRIFPHTCHCRRGPGASREARMYARHWILAFGLVLATAPAAGAAQKDPVAGSVTCYCACNAEDANGAEMNYNKIIGGTVGNWTQSRGACQEFNGSSCTAKDSKGNWHTGKLKSCDTHVHSARGSKKPQAPAADTLAPATKTPSGGTNKLKLRLKQQRVTQ
jgi:hypothetical protein